MPLFDKEYFKHINELITKKEYRPAIKQLAVIKDDIECSVLDKLSAYKLLLETYIKLVDTAKTEEEKINYTSEKIEALLMLKYYTFLNSDEGLSAMHYDDIPLINDTPQHDSTLTGPQTTSPKNNKRLKDKNKLKISKWLKQAESYLKQDRADDALALYEKIIGLNDQHWHAHLACIKLYAEKNKTDALISTCSLVIEKMPVTDSASQEALIFAYVSLYETYLSLEDYELAEACIECANDLKPNTYSIVYALGDVFSRHMYACGIQVSLSINEIDSNENAAIKALRTHYGQTSCHYFNEALKLTDEMSQKLCIAMLLTDINCFIDNFTEARKYCLMVGELDSSRQNMMNIRLAQINFQNNHVELTLNTFEQIITRPNFCCNLPEFQSEMVFNCGIACEKLHRYDDAFSFFENALKYNSDNILARLAAERLLKSGLLTRHKMSALADFNVTASEELLKEMQEWINAGATQIVHKAYIIGLSGQVYAKLKKLDTAIACYELADSLYASRQTALNPIEQDVITKLNRLKNMKTMSSLTKESIFRIQPHQPAHDNSDARQVIDNTCTIQNGI